MPLEAIPQLPPEDVERILRYLDLPPSTTLPSPPLVFLNEHIHTLPPPLLAPLGSITTPRQRSSIPLIKSRRWLYASTSPPPPPLRADAGRLRWPLLWERLGGSSLPPPSSAVEEEESWVAENFLPGKEGRQHVKKLGGFLRGLEEEREAEGVREARRAERRLDDVGEEFDESSDEDDDEKGKVRVAGLEEDQDEVKRVFERRLLEIFVDGLDTVDYDEVDFNEPPGGDYLAQRDQEEHYFDDEAHSRTPNGSHEQGSGTSDGASMDKQNGQGEYDY